jgi:hypothetical protein
MAFEYQCSRRESIPTQSHQDRWPGYPHDGQTRSGDRSRAPARCWPSLRQAPEGIRPRQCPNGKGYPGAPPPRLAPRYSGATHTCNNSPVSGCSGWRYRAAKPTGLSSTKTNNVAIGLLMPALCTARGGLCVGCCKRARSVTQRAKTKRPIDASFAKLYSTGTQHSQSLSIFSCTPHGISRLFFREFPCHSVVKKGSDHGNTRKSMETLTTATS